MSANIAGHLPVLQKKNSFFKKFSFGFLGLTQRPGAMPGLIFCLVYPSFYVG